MRDECIYLKEYDVYLFFITVHNPYHSFPADISSNPQFLADKSSPGDRLSPEISSKDDGKAQR
jgi:hypothetical protein